MIGTATHLVMGGLVTGLGTLGLFAGIGFADLITINERSMSVVELSYQDSHFIQSHKVEGEPIKGSWSAEIMRGDEQLCSGGGEAPYEGGIKKFTPDDWTGADCPDLQQGDIARAVWEYRLNNGGLASVSAQIKIE